MKSRNVEYTIRIGQWQAKMQRDDSEARVRGCTCGTSSLRALCVRPLRVSYSNLGKLGNADAQRPNDGAGREIHHIDRLRTKSMLGNRIERCSRSQACFELNRNAIPMPTWRAAQHCASFGRLARRLKAD
jgi:hypothetical protein